MKTQFRLFIAALALLAVSFSSCKKDKDNNSTNTSDYTSEFSAQSEDQVQVSNDVDEVADDANNILDEHPSLNGKITNLLCNATVVVDSLSDPKTVTITYNGTNCRGNRTRSGQVVLSMPLGVHWSDANAVLTVTINNLRITRIRDGRSITISGVTTYTNVSGGRIRDLANLGGTITHSIQSAGITVTFDNNTQRTWQIAKQRVFSYNNGIVITTTGTHTDGSTTGISEWGTNRFGNAFATQISAALVVRQDCDWRLVSGEVKHDRLVRDIVVTFGLDAQGNPTSCPGTGTFYYKIVWTNTNGVVRTVILPY
ncbi:MAG: hypothetical protein QM737_17170 [Ferruginibacter sp.]